jgi:hypothetical protein
MTFLKGTTWRGFISCFLVSMGTIAFGYPQAIVGSTLAKPSFLKYMDLGGGDGIFPGKEDLAGTIASLFQVSSGIEPKSCAFILMMNSDWSSCRPACGVRGQRPLWTQTRNHLLLHSVHCWRHWGHCVPEYGDVVSFPIHRWRRQFCLPGTE